MTRHREPHAPSSQRALAQVRQTCTRLLRPKGQRAGDQMGLVCSLAWSVLSKGRGRPTSDFEASGHVGLSGVGGGVGAAPALVLLGMVSSPPAGSETAAQRWAGVREDNATLERGGVLIATSARHNKDVRSEMEATSG